MDQDEYIIHGGVEGRERLRILSRVMAPSTVALLRRAGIGPGMAVLEVGAGGGEVAAELARLVGPGGRVLAVDLDEAQLAIARSEAPADAAPLITFQRLDITAEDPPGGFDAVHARFLLSHLADPETALRRMAGALRPGGLMVVEDVDFRGHFCHPDRPSLARYVALYTAAAAAHGADANLGARLTALLAAAGFTDIAMHVVQPAGASGEVKLMNAITMANIAGAVVGLGLATREETQALIADLDDLARTDGAVASIPRVVEAWGRKG